MLLLSDDVSEHQDQAERKIPGEHPGINHGRVVMKVKDKVGYDQRSQADKENDFPR